MCSAICEMMEYMRMHAGGAHPRRLKPQPLRRRGGGRRFGFLPPFLGLRRPFLGLKLRAFPLPFLPAHAIHTLLRLRGYTHCKFRRPTVHWSATVVRTRILACSLRPRMHIVYDMCALHVHMLP